MIPEAVDEINNKHDDNVEIETIQENKRKGWKPNYGSDYVDIKLSNGYVITKIKVLKSSNVKKFELWFEDVEEFIRVVKVNNTNIRIILNNNFKF